jgi:hypothetical protein
MTDRPALRVLASPMIDPVTGEVHPAAPSYPDALAELDRLRRLVVELEAVIDDTLPGLESTIRSQAATITKLRRDRDRDARSSELWPIVRELFDEWRRETALAAGAKKPRRSKFTTDRFEVAMPFVRDHGVALCRAAIAGIAFDPFVTQRKNGTAKRHDGWDLVFRSSDKLEEFAKRAPAEAIERIRRESMPLETSGKDD